MKNLKCIGCGALLQSEYHDKEGYLENLEDINSDVIYCQRCFRLKHYNELPKIKADFTSFNRVLNEVKNKNSLVVLIIDIFNLENTFVPNMTRYLNPKNVILVVNKIDLLPHSVKPEKILEYVDKLCQKNFFSVLSIQLVSSLKGSYLDSLMNLIDEVIGDRDLYFIGASNTGKSTLINAILKKFTSKTTDLITTSMIPGTTLDFINIPFFDNNRALIDTPGYFNEHSIEHYLSLSDWQNVMPKKEIKPLTYQIEAGQTLFVSLLVSIDLIETDGFASFTGYFSPNINFHRTKTTNKENILNSLNASLFKVPDTKTVQSFTYITKEFVVSKNKKEDLVLPGLGFICINKEAKVVVRYPSFMEVGIRNALI